MKYTYWTQLRKIQGMKPGSFERYMGFWCVWYSRLISVLPIPIFQVIFWKIVRTPGIGGLILKREKTRYSLYTLAFVPYYLFPILEYFIYRSFYIKTVVVFVTYRVVLYFYPVSCTLQMRLRKGLMVQGVCQALTILKTLNLIYSPWKPWISVQFKERILKAFKIPSICIIIICILISVILHSSFHKTYHNLTSSVTF